VLNGVVADKTEHPLTADTAMGPITFRVADLDAMTRYYRDAVALTVLHSEGQCVPSVTAPRPSWW